jgi:MoxR-like ATPase
MKRRETQEQVTGAIAPESQANVVTAPEIAPRTVAIKQPQISDELNSVREIAIRFQEQVVMSDVDTLMFIGAAMTQGHLKLEAGPGTGKTNAAKRFAELTGASFARQQGSEDQTPSDFTGFMMINPETGKFEFNPGPVFSNIFLADEFNRSPEKAQDGVLEALEEKQVTPAGSSVTHKLPEFSWFIATQNPGIGKVRGAAEDRFAVQLVSPNITGAISRQIAAKKALAKAKGPQPVLATPDDLVKIGKAIEETIGMSDEVDVRKGDIIDRIMEDPRIDQLSSVIGSNRVYEDVDSAAKFVAFYEGRKTVENADIDFVLPYVVEHRINPTRQAAKDQQVSSKLIVVDGIQAVNAR